MTLVSISVRVPLHSRVAHNTWRRIRCMTALWKGNHDPRAGRCRCSHFYLLWLKHKTRLMRWYRLLINDGKPHMMQTAYGQILRHLAPKRYKATLAAAHPRTVVQEGLHGDIRQLNGRPNSVTNLGLLCAVTVRWSRSVKVRCVAPSAKQPSHFHFILRNGMKILPPSGRGTVIVFVLHQTI
jgi:hypothetical protein